MLPKRGSIYRSGSFLYIVLLVSVDPKGKKYVNYQKLTHDEEMVLNLEGGVILSVKIKKALVMELDEFKKEFSLSKKKNRV